jgi:hypothetical protein
VRFRIAVKGSRVEVVKICDCVQRDEISIHRFVDFTGREKEANRVKRIS